MYPRLLQLGPVAIPASGLLTAIAIVAALLTSRAAARRLQLDSERVWDLGVAGAFTALLAPRLVLIVTNWSDFLAHPLWMLGVVNIRSRAAVIGGIALAVAAMGVFAHFAQLPLRRTLDALAPALAIGLAIFNTGDFIAGSSFGTPTTLPWAVVYTKRIASLWYGTPLGTPLHPVQIYAALLELCLFTLSLAMIVKQIRWRLRTGEIMGAYLFLHGFASFLLYFLRSDLAPDSFVLDQAIAALLTFAGGILWLV